MFRAKYYYKEVGMVNATGSFPYLSFNNGWLPRPIRFLRLSSRSEQNQGVADSYVQGDGAPEKLFRLPRGAGRKLFAPIVIDTDIIVVSNPVAGNGKARDYVTRLSQAIGSMVVEGRLRINGGISYLITEADPARRVSAIADAIMTSPSPNPPYVIAVGGDGTFADTGAGALLAAREGARSVIVPTNAGTACDMRRELGVPRSPEKLFTFIAKALPIKLSAISIRMDGGPERILLHSMGIGVSGAVFHEVERIVREGGRSSISAYLKGLARGVVQTKPFFASVDGSPRVAVGEVLTLSNSTSVGGVTRVPLPADGGRIHLIPVDARREGVARLEKGVTALADVFGRGLSYMMGDQRVIAPGEEIPILSAGFTTDVMPGDAREVELTDASGRPARVKAVLNGDAMGDVSRITVANGGESIDSLASFDSGILVRKGEVFPKGPLDRVQEYADGVGDRIVMASKVGSFGGVMRSSIESVNLQTDEVAMANCFCGMNGLDAYLAGSLPIFLPTTLAVVKPF